MSAPTLRTPSGANGAAPVVAHTANPGLRASTLQQRDSLLDAADIFRKAGYVEAAKRIEVRARRFSPVVLP